MIKVEYSKDLEKAKIANIGIGIDGKKIVRLYEHSNEENYKVGHITKGTETTNKLMRGRQCLVELTFYHNESIDSLIKVLQDIKNADFIDKESDPETYKNCKEVLEEKNNLVLHAERELNKLVEICKKENEDTELQEIMNKDILDVVEIFSNQGHSGFSASYAINMINKLLKYEPITALTGEDAEWTKLDYTDEVCYQNKRCSRVFKDANGQAYDIEGKIFSDNGGKSWYTSRDSRVNIEFPYVPHTEKIMVNNKLSDDK